MLNGKGVCTITMGESVISQSLEAENYKQVIAVRKDLNMRKGKIAAQVAHTINKMFKQHLVAVRMLSEAGELPVSLALSYCFLAKQAKWVLGDKATKIVVGVESEDELVDLIEKAKGLGIPYQDIIDAGLTEFGGVPTRTCVGFGPGTPEELDPLTGHLPLL